MLSENIILQSAGSLSVAVLALFMLIAQILFLYRKPQLTWYAWSAATSFSALLYSVGIFLEYNTPQGPLNRFSGLLEFTAVICLIHCLYGFTFSYLGIESKRYHLIAGVCHVLILILLWSTNYIVAERFTTRNFIGLESPYIEAALGPLGPVFVLYAVIAALYAMIVWIRHKRTDSKHRITFLAGMGFWVLLGIHDGLASLGVPTLQYVMEYGFLGFAIAVLWVVFNSYLEIAAEENYRVITEFANDSILVVQHGKLVYGNPACSDLIGRPLTNSEGTDLLDIMASEDRKTVLERYNTLLEGGHVANPHTVCIRRADGEQRFVEIATSVIQYKNRPAVLAIIRDMTERKGAEDALRESEKKYRELVDFLPIPLFETDLQGNIISGNHAIFEAFGYAQDDLEKGLNVLHMTSTKDRDRVKANIQKVLSGEKKGGAEYRGIRKDGSIFPEIIFSSPILHENKPVGLRGAIIDLTAQKQTEASLQKISLSLGEAQRIAHIGNWEWDIESDEMYCSDEIYRIVGATHQTFDGTYESFSELIYADDRESVLKAVQKAIDEGAKSEFEHRIVRFDGSILEIRQRVEPILDDTGRAVRVIGIVQDVTEKNQADRDLQKARDQLLQSEKLASMGRLSAGVAHEILNPVNIISMELQILQTMETLAPEIREELGICMDQIRRIVTIAENLKQFSRIPAKKATMVMADINDVIGHVLALYSTQLKIEGVETEFQYQSDLPEISIEREKIEQVIANLISNAMSFMEGRDHKVLRITTKREVLMGGYGQLRIVVADTGTGIKSEHMSKIFDPFFTTKEQGKGTGLGLSISYGIIQDHGGKIWAENNEWGGASFYIELPEKPNISPIPEKNR
jgi:PAS domain S-box-containing protein